jgi:hypothetical protein
MAHKHTISFYDHISSAVITLQIAQSDNIHVDGGYWNTDNNQILLGKVRFAEWEDLTGYLEKQIQFIFKLEKVTQSLIEQKSK